MECPDVFVSDVERWLEGAGRAAAEGGVGVARAS